MKKIIFSILIALTFVTYADNSIPLICPKEVATADLQQGLKWYRHSAEKNALYNQGYNIATLYIKNWVKENHPKPKTWGIVLDIDETTLDNTWYFETCRALLLKHDKNVITTNSKTVSGTDFGQYVSAPKKSIALPGVVKLTHMVHKMGGTVSVVSNRNGNYTDKGGNMLATTIENLKNQDIYFDQVLLANSNSSNPGDKNPRFNAIITGKYDDKQMVKSNVIKPSKTIAYFGDNIQDFPDSNQKNIYKLDSNDPIFEKFGRGYFIFPNPIYGSWENN